MYLWEYTCSSVLKIPILKYSILFLLTMKKKQNKRKQCKKIRHDWIMVVYFFLLFNYVLYSHSAINISVAWTCVPDRDGRLVQIVVSNSVWSNTKKVAEFADIKVLNSEISIVSYTDYINNTCVACVADVLKCSCFISFF